MNHFEHLHSKYDCEESLSALAPKLKIDTTEYSKMPSHSNSNVSEEIPNIQKGFNFFSPILNYEDTKNTHYLDFCAGISINFDCEERENSESYESISEKVPNICKPNSNSIEKLQETFNNSQKIPNISYVSIKHPRIL